MRTIWLALAAVGLAATPAAADELVGTGVTVPPTPPESPVTTTVDDPDLATLTTALPVGEQPIDESLEEPVLDPVLETPVLDLSPTLPGFDAPTTSGEPLPASASVPAPDGAAPPPRLSPAPGAGPGGHAGRTSPGTTEATSAATGGASPLAVPDSRSARPFGSVAARTARPFAIPLLLAAALVAAAGHGWSRRDPRLLRAPVDNRDEHLRFR